MFIHSYIPPSDIKRLGDCLAQDAGQIYCRSDKIHRMQTYDLISLKQEQAFSSLHLHLLAGRMDEKMS